MYRESARVIRTISKWSRMNFYRITLPLILMLIWLVTFRFSFFFSHLDYNVCPCFNFFWCLRGVIFTKTQRKRNLIT